MPPNAPCINVFGGETLVEATVLSNIAIYMHTSAEPSAETAHTQVMGNQKPNSTGEISACSQGSQRFTYVTLRSKTL